MARAAAAAVLLVALLAAVAACTSTAGQEALTLDELGRLADDLRDGDAGQVLLEAGLTPEEVLAVGRIADDLSWEPPSSTMTEQPAWVDAGGRERTADRELREALGADHHELVRDLARSG